MEGQPGNNARIALFLAGGAGLCAGLVAGFLSAHYLAERRIRHEVEAQVEKELVAVKSHYRGLIKKCHDDAHEMARQIAATMAPPGPGDNEGDREPAVGGRDPAGKPAYAPRVAYNRPVSAAGPRALPAEDADGDPGGGDSPEGVPGDSPAAEDNFWPAEEPEPGDPAVSPVAPSGTLIEIITKSEFDDEEEMNFEKASITYYEGDKVLTDDHDVPIRDNAHVVGVDFVNYFDSADDPDVVYVRNFRLNMDFEIVRKRSGYAEEVLGYRKPL